MGRWTLLCVVIAFYHTSSGSTDRSSPTLASSDPVSVILSASRNTTDADGSAGEVILRSQGSGEFLDGGGNRTVDTQKTNVPTGNTEISLSAGVNESRHSTLLSPSSSLVHSPTHHKLTDDGKAISEDPESPSKQDPVGSRVRLTMSPVSDLPPLEAHDQEPDQHDPSVIETPGHFYSNEHLKQPTEILTDGAQITADEHLHESEPPIVDNNFLTGKQGPGLPVQYSVLHPVKKQDASKTGGPCVLGHSLSSFSSANGTRLLWDDMRRTLAFAWELHVYGSAGLFVILAVMALLGMAGASTLLHPLCDVLRLANCLLLLTGALRAVLLLLDPYGTRQVLSRPTLTVLHNMPLQLLLWAQVSLALVTLRGLKLVLLPLKLQRPLLVGGLAFMHCTLLLITDLLSPTLAPALPLLLQTLSLCWGLPFCMGILTQSLSNRHPSVRTPLPQLGGSQRIENRGRRVTAVCALLGVLCCSLQMYSLLWLYGLLGNWRRFGWGWWLSQFWARIMEFAWGVSLLVLGSWIFWSPRRSRSKADHGHSRQEVSKGLEEIGFWETVLTKIQKSPFRKPEKKWQDLIPNNWASCKLHRPAMNNNTKCTHDKQDGTSLHDHCPCPVTSSSFDSQAALLWKKVGEHECVLSLIEFDMRPPSPANLRRSIDDALHHGHLAVGSIFTPPPPPFTHTVGADATHGHSSTMILSPAHLSYRWTVDTELTLGSPICFHAAESLPSLNPPADQVGQSTVNTSAASEVVYHEDWSEDDITDL